MFGIGFIIIGIIILLQTAGVFGTIPAGIIWGTALILVGILIAMRRTMRGQRRREWMEKHREKWHEHEKSKDSSDDQKSA